MPSLKSERKCFFFLLFFFFFPQAISLWWIAGQEAESDGDNSKAEESEKGKATERKEGEPATPAGKDEYVKTEGAKEKSLDIVGMALALSFLGGYLIYLTPSVFHSLAGLFGSQVVLTFSLFLLFFSSFFFFFFFFLLLFLFLLS
jgi:hypothetical protein